MTVKVLFRYSPRNYKVGRQSPLKYTKLTPKKPRNVSSKSPTTSMIYAKSILEGLKDFSKISKIILIQS